jgi:hypothetical protein
MREVELIELMEIDVQSKIMSFTSTVSLASCRYQRGCIITTVNNKIKSMLSFI